MANNKLIVEERQRNIGKFLVGRLLPFREKRTVGPFVFIDHMGPIELTGGKYFDVDQHPHIGLSTLTYLYEGEIEHRDSKGSVQVISPGDVGFMSAGKGITHTERTPNKIRDGRNVNMHGYQIWVGHPKELEEMEPRFDYFPENELVKWETNQLKFKLPAGEAFGKKAKLTGYSPLFMVDIEAKKDCKLDLTEHLKGELAIVIVSGRIKEENEILEEGQMLVSKTNEICSIELEAGTKVLLFGGEPFPEPRFLLWNFSSSSKDRLQKAKEDWINKKFPKIPGDDTYIEFK